MIHDVLDGAEAVGLVIDREPGIDPHQLGVNAQQPGAEAVKRTHPDPGIRHQDLDTLAHLAGRLVREGYGQNVLRRDSRLQQVGDPPGDDPRLARPGSGQDQKRSVNVGNRCALGRRQVVK